MFRSGNSFLKLYNLSLAQTVLEIYCQTRLHFGCRCSLISGVEMGIGDVLIYDYKPASSNQKSMKMYLNFWLYLK